jgi:hypothetical protein
MSYFNHAFNKTFVGTSGFVTDAATNELALGEFGFYTKAWAPVTIPTAAPLYLVAGSIHTNDKIGPFAGGYKESVKSKLINPKYISNVYKVEYNVGSQSQLAVGNMDTVAETLACKKEYLCGNTYNLRIDVKGSPALRTLTHNAYLTVSAYTGCCADPATVEAVDPRMVYDEWMSAINTNPIMSKFVEAKVAVSTNGGTTWTFYTTKASSYDSANATDDNYLVGLLITGAYVDTTFGDCTFYPTDSLISKYEPVQLYASEVDLGGDPCIFGGACVTTICRGFQANGQGETFVRHLIMTEAYMQQPFYTGQDLRIREITNGTDVFDAIDRSTYYNAYYIQHNIPRLNNPTSTFDNDQYLLEIIVPTTFADESTFESFLGAWLAAAGNTELFTDDGEGVYSLNTDQIYGNNASCSLVGGY